MDAIEASPDGTKLYVAGNFSAVNGVTKRGLARISLTTGAAVSTFTANTDARVTEIAASNSTVYLGGIFTRVNSVVRRSLAAVNGTTGAVDTGFVNNLSGGIGVNGALSVQRLKLTRDLSKLLVVHTGRQVNGQDRYGVALISTATKQLLPWRTRLWEDNLQFVGGIQRAFGADIAPGDDWFAVTSGSGGDRPPINDTVMAFPINGGDDVQPRWISRHFDSVYSIAITEKAVYVGGHMGWAESPTSPDPWPGLDDVGYGTGQGLSGYALGDAVVNREHLAALNPTDGKALEWNPGSNSYEGNKAMEATTRGLFTGGDATTQGGATSVGSPSSTSTPCPPATAWRRRSPSRSAAGSTRPRSSGWSRAPHRCRAAASPGWRSRSSIGRHNRYLADNLTTWATTANTINATLQSTGTRTANWSLPLTVMRQPQAVAACADGLLDRGRRRHQGDEEDRDLRADRPAPEHQCHRPVRQRDQDICVHRDRHGHRRHRRQLDQHDDPRREQPLPAGRRHRVLDEQLVQDHPGRRGGEEHHLVQGDHGAQRRHLEGPGQSHRHGRANRTSTQPTAIGSSASPASHRRCRSANPR